jgi:Ca-activated chloride channel family protein
MFHFAWPWMFLLVPLPLFIYLFFSPIAKEKSAIIVPFYQQLAVLRHSGLIKKSTYFLINLILLIIIWLLVVAATARPQWAGELIAAPSSGRDLLVAVDISDSMDQQDMVIDGNAATRLEAVKHVLKDFIKRREGDRIGLILFGSNAYLQAPLTFDTTTVGQFLVEAQLGFAGPKTAIGEAIGLSVKRLQELESSTNRVIILLTDGANTAGEIEPLQAATLAKQTDVKIYTIGIGADEMVIRGFFGPRKINPSTQLDEKTLVDIAQTTNGKYFRAKETEELENIYKELDALEPISQVDQWFRPTHALYYWPLTIALILSALLALLKAYPLGNKQGCI